MLKSNIVNFYDLAILREIIPFLRLRYRATLGRMRRTSPVAKGDVLIVAPCIVGDCLSCLPAIEAFARENQISYDLMVSPDFRTVAERLKGVRRVFLASSSYKRATENSGTVEQKIPGEYDLVVVLRISPGAFSLIKHIKYGRIICSDFTLLKYLIGLTKSSLLKKPVMQARSVIYDVFGLKRASTSGQTPDLFANCADQLKRIAGIPSLKGDERKVLIHPGSGWQVKLWSDDRWVGLLKLIHSVDNCRFIFIGRGDVERSVFERIQSRLDFELHSLIDRLNLWELFLVMKRCDAFIGIDSGPRNLAHLADLRSITLLNPAAVNNFMPFDDRDILVERQNRFPANIINTRRGASLSDISEEQVFGAYRKLMIETTCPVRVLN